jgi:hypothetical protein
MKHLHYLGAINYFITGTVIDHTDSGEPTGGIYDEVCAIGFDNCSSICASVRKLISDAFCLYRFTADAGFLSPGIFTPH